MNVLKNLFLFFAFFICSIFFSCAKKAVATATKSDTNSTIKSTSKYTEDLSAVRPKYSGISNPVIETKIKAPIKNNTKPIEKTTVDVTDKLQVVLDSIAVHNKAIRSAPGYRVQIYVGESRDEALQARNKSYSLFPDETPHLIPTLPSYRVRVGDFMDRLEAQKVYKTLIKEFPNALVVTDKIEIKKFADDQNEDK